MRRIYIVFVILGIGLVPFKATAQDLDSCSFSLSGQVIDEHDQSVLAYATVYLKDLQRGVVADSLGYYQLDGLCVGTYQLVVNHVSCEPAELVVALSGHTRKILLLEHHVEELRDITIKGQSIDATSAPTQSLDISVINRFSTGSLGDALQEITGVSSLNTGNTIVKPVIQGLYGSRVLTINHGVRLQDMEWGDEHAPNIDINAAGSVTVIKGAAALQYGGDAIGGVVIVEPIKIAADTLFGKTSLSGASNGRGGAINSQLVKGWKNGWYVNLQGSLKRFGDFKAPDYSLTNTGVFEKGAAIHFGLERSSLGVDLYYSFYKNEIAVLRSSHIGNVDDLVRAINNQDPVTIDDFSYHLGAPKQEVAHHLGKLRVFKRFDQLGLWNLQYDFQHNRRFEFDIRVGDDRDKPAIDLELTTHSWSTDFTWDYNPNYLLKVGLLYRYQHNFANPDTGIKRLIPDYDKSDLGVFTTVDYYLSNRWWLDLGLRYDFNHIDAQKFYRTSRWEERGYDTDFSNLVTDDLGTQLLVNPVFDYHNMSATAGLQYRWDDQYKFLFNYALAQRAPNPSELFSDGLHHSAARIELGDLRIGQETSHKLSISLRHESEKLGWEVAPYANFINDFILLEPNGVEQTLRGAFPVWEYRQTIAQLWGVDANLKVNWDVHWRTDHRFAWVKGDDTEGDRPLINIPAPNLRNSLTYHQDNWNSLSITLESQYTFRQENYPNNNFEVFLPESDRFEVVDISTPPDGYFLFNWNLEAEYPFLKNNTLGVGLTVNNMLNQKYRNYMNRLRFFGDELGRNFQVRLIVNY